MSRSSGMPRRKKTIPTFADEDAEREFWSTADSTDYVDWRTAKRVTTARRPLSESGDLAAAIRALLDA